MTTTMRILLTLWVIFAAGGCVGTIADKHYRQKMQEDKQDWWMTFTGFMIIGLGIDVFAILIVAIWEN